MKRNADRHRRLEALEGAFPPPPETLATSFPGIDEAGISALAAMGLDVALAAVERLGIPSLPDAGKEEQELVTRAIDLVMNEFAERIRAGDRTPPPTFYGEGPDLPPDFDPTAIDRLLIRAGWTPPKS